MRKMLRKLWQGMCTSLRLGVYALDIFADVSENASVVAVEDLKIQPSSRPATAVGEVAMVATARVTLCFDQSL